MDLSRALLLREALSDSDLTAATDEFGRAVRHATTRNDGLMLFGPRDAEPWHLAAHIDDELHHAGIDDLRAALVRWAPEVSAPAQLAIGLDRLGRAGRGDSLVVVSEAPLAADALERVDDVRRRGSTVFAIGAARDHELAGLAHELLVPATTEPAGLVTDPFELAQHFVSMSMAGSGTSAPQSRAGWRRRLRRMIQAIGD